MKMQGPIYIDGKFIDSHTSYPDLVTALSKAFAAQNINAPLRHHHDFQGSEQGKTSSLLLMPAWETGQSLGVKLITVYPDNKELKLPSIQGIYLYMDANNFSIKAMMDAKSLTLKRTAAVSALASSFLSRKNTSTLLMVGTGALAPHLIDAHASIRPIKTVYVWGRNYEKATQLCSELSNRPYSISPIKDLHAFLGAAGIISCATLSKEALVIGKHLRKGQHIDLVGSYKPDMREADDETMRMASVFVDERKAGLEETGDLIIPIQNGSLSEKDLVADLTELCTGLKKGRASEEQITLFKSVGLAMEDLTAADYYFKRYSENQ